MKKKITMLIVFTIFILGLVFRIWAILDNHSFWADEAFVAGIAKDIVNGEISMMGKIGGLYYQRLYVITTALSFALFGISEFSARLPVALFSSIGILFAYYIGKKLSNNWGGLLSAFVYSFSYLNLAHSTQAKPYAIIQILLLAVASILLSSGGRGISIKKHIAVVSLLIVSFFYQNIAVLFWPVYLVYLILIYKKNLSAILKKPAIMLAIAVLALIWLKLFNIAAYLKILAFSHNNTQYLTKLFLKEYEFMLVPAVFGFFLSFKKRAYFNTAVLIMSGLYLFIWNTASYSHNVRYIMPIFSFLIIYFAVFWARIGAQLYAKRAWLVPLVTALILYASGNKIARRPLPYYNPNIDMYGDVQSADYKTMYAQIKQKYPNYMNITIFNDLADTENWYMGRYSNAYFMKWVDKPYAHGLNNVMIYGTLADFKKQVKKHKTGLIIIEDWESYMPEDIKNYVKQNMKLEIEVDGLKQAQGDPWPLKVYSF